MHRTMWGICLMLVGVSLLGNFLGIFNMFSLFAGWWTLFIIVPALIDLFTKENKTGSLIFLSVGITLLLHQQHLINTGMIWKILLSMFIIILGINAIFFKNHNFEMNTPKDIKNKTGVVSFTAFFSGTNRVYRNEKFEGADISATFGGIKLDLSEAIIENDVVITASSVFGGCEITVPKNINVKIMDNNNILGGVDNKTEGYNEDFNTIYIKSNTIFGGIEIK